MVCEVVVDKGVVVAVELFKVVVDKRVVVVGRLLVVSKNLSIIFCWCEVTRKEKIRGAF